MAKKTRCMRYEDRQVRNTQTNRRRKKVTGKDMLRYMEEMNAQSLSLKTGEILSPPEKHQGETQNSLREKYPGNQRPTLENLIGGGSRAKQGLKPRKTGGIKKGKTLEQIRRGQKKSSKKGSLGVNLGSDESEAKLATFEGRIQIEAKEINQTQFESTLQPVFLRPEEDFLERLPRENQPECRKLARLEPAETLNA